MADKHQARARRSPLDDGIATSAASSSGGAQADVVMVMSRFAAQSWDEWKARRQPSGELAERGLEVATCPARRVSGLVRVFLG